MLRHSRLHTRNARERYITKRRRQFARWCSGVDYEVGTRLAASGYYSNLAVRAPEFIPGVKPT